MDSEEGRWIVIPNWDEFQHYRDRDPVWIKTYTRLLSDDAYRGLSYHLRGVIHSTWMEYARAQRQLSDSTLILTRQLGQRVLRRDLDALNRAGFIDFSASRPLARRYHDASPEKRREEALTHAEHGDSDLRCKNCGEPIRPGQVCPACGVNPRAAGSNPRAVAQKSIADRHLELLADADDSAKNWNGGGSDIFDSHLDALERQHHDTLTSLERDALWTVAFNR